MNKRKTKEIQIFIIFIMMFTATSIIAQQKDSPSLKLSGLTGPYLGQKPPGDVPELFAPGIVSTGGHEFWISMTPDGREIYFTVRAGLLGQGYNVILCMEHAIDGWKGPSVTSFSGRYSDKESCIYNDGSKMVFNSMRPKSGHGEPELVDGIWVTERIHGNWAEPTPLTEVDLGERRMSPCISNSGNLYFSGNYEFPENQPDIYISKFVGGRYSTPERLRNGVNSEYYEGHVFVSPNEDYLIFDSIRPDGFGGTDMYISYRSKEGYYSNAVHLGERVNSASHDSAPFVTRDGKYLFFFSDRANVKHYSKIPLSYLDIRDRLNQPQNGNGDIYWVDAKMIEDLRPNVMK